MTKYLSCAETAKLLRAALKESFPGVKFGVRSKTYSGGASIDVGWTDGPTGQMVKEVCDLFEGSYFDGMIDYKGANYHTLDGEKVHLGADFIFENRKLTEARAQAIANHFADKWGRSDWLEVSGGEYFGWRVYPAHQAPYIQPELEQYDRETCGVVREQNSATLARLGLAGDDGYGAGTVGPDPENPNGEQCYKAIEENRQRQLALKELGLA